MAKKYQDGGSANKAKKPYSTTIASPNFGKSKDLKLDSKTVEDYKKRKAAESSTASKTPTMKKGGTIKSKKK